MVDVYNTLHFLSTITKFVSLTLMMFNGHWNDAYLASFILAFLAFVLLVIAQVFDAFASLRNNIPPIVTVVLIGIAELMTVAEIVIVGINAFNGDTSNILAAAFTYEIICFLSIISLIILLVIQPPARIEEV